MNLNAPNILFISIQVFYLLLFNNGAESIVCTPDTCAAIQCLKIENCDGPKQVIKPGGLCKCCNMCHTILSENENCSLLTGFLGVPPPTSECGQGLVCHEGKCKSFKAIGGR